MKRTHFNLLVLSALVVVGLIGYVTGSPIELAGLAMAPMMIGNTMGAEELKAIEKSLTDALGKKVGEMNEVAQKAIRDEVKRFETITGETNEKIAGVLADGKKTQEALAEVKQRLLDIEQKGGPRGGGAGGENKSAGQIFAESPELAAAVKGQKANVDPVHIGNAHKTALINATGQNQPLVPDQRVPGIVTAANRRLAIRDLLPAMRTTSNLVQFASESAFTNNAAIVVSSPLDRENVTKPESALTFSLSNAPVQTIAHWIPASRQILADAPGLASYIDGRLMYGLKYAEEAQLLTGDGTGANLTGINTGATAYNRGASNDTMLDTILKAMLQVQVAEYFASGIILNPIDWTQIRLLKDTTGRYLFGNPQDTAEPRLWGLPVVGTNSQTSGRFTVGAFDLAAAIWDREDATVRVSEHHDTFFVKNMVAILCEERLALTIYRSTAVVYGTLPALGT